MEAFVTHTGRALPLRRTNVDTDQIIPAVYLKRVTRTGFDDGLFQAWRANEPDFVLNQDRFRSATVLVTGPDFGTGSSREHAAWALRAWGIRAILSTSFADIFRSNALKNGVLPIVVDPATHRRLVELLEADPDAELRVDLAEQGVLLPDGSTIDFDVDPFSKLMLMAGTDEIGYVAGKASDIAAWEAVHPARVDTRLGTPLEV
jgi:3-isopropylmalate/(R)-2-methylmalate dehydratase small subunit